MDTEPQKSLSPWSPYDVFPDGPYRGVSRYVGLVVRDSDGELRRLIKEAVEAGKTVLFRSVP